MDLTRLRELDSWSWTVPPAPGESLHEVKLYGSRELLQTMDDKVLEQITNVARLPGLVGAAMTMPDAHWGYGFPIGGVAAFDAERGGIISAGGVGFDISCGIRCLRTDLRLTEIMPRLKPLADGLYRDILAGVGEGGHIRLDVSELDRVLSGGATWAVEQGYGEPEDLEFVEEKGCAPGAVPANVSALAKKRQLGEMGTLGSGNHYLEVQWVERILDAEAARAFGLFEGQILISIHCGSRGLGHQVCTDHVAVMDRAMARHGITVPDRQLACAPIDSSEGRAYLGAMAAAANFAGANRQMIAQPVRSAFERGIGRGPARLGLDLAYDLSHNIAKFPRHRVCAQEI